MCAACVIAEGNKITIYVQGWGIVVGYQSQKFKSDQQRDDSLVGKKEKNDVPGVDAPKPVPNNVL
jgi:hypothetical protein